jgi:putative tryptophan/tyrosine transport system substrate-binding protein
MRRRDFIGILGALALSRPIKARAQRADRMRRVGLILPLGEDDPEAQSRVKAFRLGLRDLDWLEGRNIHIDYRFAAGDPMQIKEQAAELISLAPDVIVGNGTPVLAALRQATTSIPIVFSIVNDPLGQGFVSSMSHPGSNITGFSFIDFPMIGKWIGMLKDVSPSLSRAALMFDPDTSPYYDVYLRSFERVSRSIAVEISAAPVRDETEVEQTIARLGQEAGSGLIAGSDTFVIVHRDAILRSVKTHGVPVISPYKQFVREGGLMSYGPDTADIFRRAGSYVDRILRGEKAADLPVQSPIKFELVINMVAAKELRLTIHSSFAMLADEVIE